MNIKDTIDKIKEIITMLPSIIETSTAIFLTPGDKQAFQEAISILKAYEEAGNLLLEKMVYDTLRGGVENIENGAFNKAIDLCTPILTKAIKERDEAKDRLLEGGKIFQDTFEKQLKAEVSYKNLLDKITVERVGNRITSMLKSHAEDGDINLMNSNLDWEALGKWYAQAIVSDIKGGE